MCSLDTILNLGTNEKAIVIDYEQNGMQLNHYLFQTNLIDAGSVSIEYYRTEKCFEHGDRFFIKYVNDIIESNQNCCRPSIEIW